MTIWFACPACRLPLANGHCETCGRVYESGDGVAVLLSSESRGAQQQATFFDDVENAEFEIERPQGTPRLYGWLLRSKFRRAVGRLPLAGRTALVVCGGSGMDAEFLATAGAEVVSSDISLGAARRTKERAERHDFHVVTIVADAERLPFADRSIDIVYVHDGLHHLESPLAGLREMARVARSAVCITEPAEALVTVLAVRLGLALEREEAGNRVARLCLADVSAALESEGFRIERARRYGMFYRHEPGAAMRFFSHPLLFQLSKLGVRAGNLIFGRLGNKLSVLAVRP